MISIFLKKSAVEEGGGEGGRGGLGKECSETLMESRVIALKSLSYTALWLAWNIICKQERQALSILKTLA